MTSKKSTLWLILMLSVTQTISFQSTVAKKLLVINILNDNEKEKEKIYVASSFFNACSCVMLELAELFKRE